MKFCETNLEIFEAMEVAFYTIKIHRSLTHPQELFAPTPKPRSGLLVDGVELIPRYLGSNVYIF
jgi:hypothetical protein